MWSFGFVIRPSLCRCTQYHPVKLGITFSFWVLSVFFFSVILCLFQYCLGFIFIELFVSSVWARPPVSLISCCSLSYYPDCQHLSVLSFALTPPPPHIVDLLLRWEFLVFG